MTIEIESEITLHGLKMDIVLVAVNQLLAGVLPESKLNLHVKACFGEFFSIIASFAAKIVNVERWDFVFES